MTCNQVADRLPDWAAGRLAEDEAALVAAHLDGCADCSAQASVLGALFAARPEAPAGLGPRIARAARDQVQAAPRAGKRTWRRPAWALSAAAVLVLAVGTTLVLRAPQLVETASALGEVPLDDSQIWIADDGAIAGAPVLDDLSDEALAILLEELGE